MFRQLISQFNFITVNYIEQFIIKTVIYKIFIYISYTHVGTNLFLILSGVEGKTKRHRISFGFIQTIGWRDFASLFLIFGVVLFVFLLVVTIFLFGGPAKLNRLEIALKITTFLSGQRPRDNSRRVEVAFLRRPAAGDTIQGAVVTLGRVVARPERFSTADTDFGNELQCHFALLGALRLECGFLLLI